MKWTIKIFSFGSHLTSISTATAATGEAALLLFVLLHFISVAFDVVWLLRRIRDNETAKEMSQVDDKKWNVDRASWASSRLTDLPEKPQKILSETLFSILILWTFLMTFFSETVSCSRLNSLRVRQFITPIAFPPPY